MIICQEKENLSDNFVRKRTILVINLSEKRKILVIICQKKENLRDNLTERGQS